MTGKFPRRFGKFVLLKPLAKGGMGEIYLAAGGDVGGYEKLCVIKKVIAEKTDKGKTNRFLDEAKVVLRLSHSALVNTFDAGEVDNEFYIAMELVEGKDLREVWNRCVRMKQRIPLDVALHVVREVARALAYVHDYGDLKLVHRDVAPPNIMMAYVGDVKLTDFGLARSVLKKEQTAPGVVFGRAAYLAPEQARGEVADGRTDIYTLGIVLWELLTGQQFLQLSGLDPAAALAIVRHPKLVPPSSRAPWITPQLDQLVMKALAPDREQRFQSAEEMRQALSTVIGELAPQADAARLSEFLRGIYAETIAEERVERERFLKEEIPRFRGLGPEGVAASTSSARERDRSVAPRGEGSGAPELAGAAPHRPPAATPSPARDRARRPTPVGAGKDAVPLPGLTSAPAGGAVTAPSPRPTPSARSVSDGATTLPAEGRARAVASAPAALRLGKSLGRTPVGELLLARRGETELLVRFPVLPRPPERSAVERWRREAFAAAALRHAHVGAAVDVGVGEDGRSFAIYEAANGVDLANWLGREHRLGTRRAVALCAQLCQALAAANARGLQHRLLRPGSVLLVGPDTPAEAAKLLDFGLHAAFDLGAIVQRRPVADGLPGLVEYLAPEVLRGQAADVRAEVFGVGVLLYEMVTGAPPHAGAPDLVGRKLGVPPQSPRMFRPELSPDLERVILATLERDPQRRPANPAELERFLRALPTHEAAVVRGGRALAAADGLERRRTAREAAFRVIAELEAETEALPPAGRGP
jgi:serine/threonine protein kinase